MCIRDRIEIDERVQRLLALQQPMAADLRFLLAVSRINGDLERIGDQAVNIAQSATRIMRHPQVKPYVDLPRMSELAEGMVRDSLNALVRGDIELAHSVLQRDDQVDRLRDQLFRELLTYMMEDVYKRQGRHRGFRRLGWTHDGRAALAIEVEDPAFSHRARRSGTDLQYLGRIRRTKFHAEGIGCLLYTSRCV